MYTIRTCNTSYALCVYTTTIHILLILCVLYTLYTYHTIAIIFIMHTHHTLYNTDCTPCAPGTRAQSLCTANSDSICIPCSTCPPGFYVYELCTSDQDTLCMRKCIYMLYIAYTCIVYTCYIV